MMADELSPMEVVEYYSRDDIAQEMVNSAQDREVGGRYRSGGFGKRPDVLMYPADVKAMARSGMTSFHFSVERWRNPKMLRPGMAKKRWPKSARIHRTSSSPTSACRVWTDTRW